MVTAIIDYNSGNLRSAEKSFQRVASDPASILVTSDPETVAKADRIVLPGVGAFADCREGLSSYQGLFEAIEDAVMNRAVPFLGICVGMQMLATWGREHGQDTKGFDWISGEVVGISPSDSTLKIPHMGWNSLNNISNHAVLKGIAQGDHAYFVHSYHLASDDPSHIQATTDYGGPVTAVVARDNIIGTQFHPEKSQETGLRLIENFLGWAP